MPDKTATIGRCVWIFAVRGPLFGYLTAASLIIIQEVDSFFDVLWFPLAIVMFAPFAIPVALFVGLVPAVLVGIVYWALRAKLAAGPSAAVALSAVAAGVVCAGVAAMSDEGFAGVLTVEAWQVVILPGIVAAVLCAAYIERGLKKASARRLQE